MKASVAAQPINTGVQEFIMKAASALYSDFKEQDQNEILIGLVREVNNRRLCEIKERKEKAEYVVKETEVRANELMALIKDSIEQIGQFTKA